MAVDLVADDGGVVEYEGKRLSKWRLNSPFVQTMVACLVVFLVPGMNSSLLGLGAGGGRPQNIPIVDKTNIVGASTTIVAGILGGSINNKIGPRWTLMIAASSYPIWSGSLWWLDHGNGVAFAYVAGLYHGVGAGLLYAATGFLVSSYSMESDRGRYIASFWASAALGAVVSAIIVLGITSTTSSAHSRVPTSVFILIITVQAIGVFCAGLLVDPSTVKRNDGRSIAVFKSRGWAEEFKLLSKSLMNPMLLLLAPAFFACQTPLSFGGSLNGFYFNARTRALLNVVFWAAALLGWAIIAFLTDSKLLGRRRKRALKTAAFVAIFLIATWSAMIWFLSSHPINRHKKPHNVDWNDGSKFSFLLVIYAFFGFCWAIFQGYIVWVVSTFSNEPSKLSHFSGFVEGMRALGFAVAFGIDSNSVAFLSEAGAYFALFLLGLGFCAFSASRYMSDSIYGTEEKVVIPEGFDGMAISTPMTRSDTAEF